MKYDEIRLAWNAQAEDGDIWRNLSEYEKVEWAARLGAATERAARQKAQEEVVFFKERIARAGVEHRRALYEVLQQEREACAKVCDELVSADACARQIRAEFERWARDEFYAGMACVSDTWDEQRGMYNDAAHHMAFTAWQAARAGVEHCRALHEALQQEREACAQIVERNAAACVKHAMLRDILMSNAAAIRARTT